MRLLFWGCAAVILFVIMTLFVPMLGSAVFGSETRNAPIWRAP